MSNSIREMEILRKGQKEMLEIQSTVTEMKNIFGVITSRLNIADERISEFASRSTETFQIEMQREIRMKKNSS